MLPLLFLLPRSHQLLQQHDGTFLLRCRGCGEVSVSGGSDVPRSFERFALFCEEHDCPALLP